MFDSYLYTRLKIKSSKKVFVNFFGKPADLPLPLARLLSIMEQQLLQTVSQLKSKRLNFSTKYTIPFNIGPFMYSQTEISYKVQCYPITLDAKHFNHVQIALKNF